MQDISVSFCSCWGAGDSRPKDNKHPGCRRLYGYLNSYTSFNSTNINVTVKGRWSNLLVLL